MKSSHHQQGQAITEFLVLCLALVPLFLLIPYLGKYQDIATATQAASRYVAFEALNRNSAMSSFKPEAQLTEEVRRRFFTNESRTSTVTPIKADDKALDADPKYFNPSWKITHNNKPLVGSFNDVSVTFGAAAGATHGDAFVGKEITGAGGVAYDALSLGGLSQSGIYRANVSVKVAKLPALKFLKPFDDLDITISRNTSVVFDPWSANGARQMEDRVGKLSPIGTAFDSSGFGELLGVVIQLADLSLIIESPTFSRDIKPPQFNNLAKWRDVVPADRLKVSD